jgi:hypothetical protein
MSYDSKYKEWVEKTSNKSTKLFKVYRGVPVLQAKMRDNPPQYSYISPVALAMDYDALREKIDNSLDKASPTRTAGKAASRKTDKQDEASYYLKWQDCQLELADMKRREASNISMVQELRTKVEEISTTRSQMEKEISELKSKLATYEKMVEELKKK